MMLTFIDIILLMLTRRIRAMDADIVVVDVAERLRRLRAALIATPALR